MGKKKPAWKSYLDASSGKRWKNNKDYKEAKRYWNNSALQARNPSGYDAFKSREQAWLDQKAREDNKPKASAQPNQPNAPAGAPRDTGKYDDIRAAQEEDRQAGIDTANQLKELELKMGGISPELQKQLDQLTLQNSNLTDQIRNNQQSYSDQLKANQQSYSNQLSSLTAAYDKRMQEQAAASAAAMQRMEQMMIQQQMQAQQTQQMLQGQINSTQVALENQKRLTTNLSSAFVPQAEQSAQTVAYGDQRQNQNRATTNNSLSDLSIVTGVGSNKSLAGLQLAG